MSWRRKHVKIWRRVMALIKWRGGINDKQQWQAAASMAWRISNQ